MASPKRKRTRSGSSEPLPLLGRTEPRIGTPRTSRRTLAGPLTDLAELAGFTERDFQSLALDRSCEVEPDGQWAYETIAVLIARQNGKTGILSIRILGGLYLFDDRLILHTAADRALPRAVFEDLQHRIEDSPHLSKHISRIRTSNGSEEIKMKDGNSYRILAPHQDAWRGWPQVGLTIFDEVREQRSDALWSAAMYTQRSHPNPQRYAVSNAGDPDSIVLRRLVERGRAAAEDPASDPKMCFLEWSTPDEYEIDDPEGWAYANPELGRSLRVESMLEELRSDDASRFETEALCRWVATAGRLAIPMADWIDCGDPSMAPMDPDPTVHTFFSIDIDPGRTDAALLIGQISEGEPLTVGVAESWINPAGVDEIAIAARVEEWIELYRPDAIGFDPYTTGSLAERLQYHATWTKIHGVAYVSACLSTWDLVTAGRIRHPADPYMDAQIAAAGRKDVGDGAFTIARLRSDVAIPAVVSLARLVALATEPINVAEIL